MVEYPPKRHRLALSCIECRQRKVRCDRSNPCIRCVASKRVCHYRPQSGAVTASVFQSPANSNSLPISPDTHQVLPDSSLPSAESTLVHIDTLHSNKEEASSSQALCQTRLQTTQDHVMNIEKSDNHTPAALWKSQGLERLHPKENTSNEIPSPDNLRLNQNSDSNGKQIIPIDLNRTIIKGRFFGRSHWMTTGQELRRMKDFLYDKSSMPEGQTGIESLKKEISKLGCECKRVAKLRKLSRPSRSVTYNQLITSPPPRDIADKLAHLYISRFESVFRILHIPSFWTEYEQYWDKQESAPATSQFKVLLVLAIGSSIYQAGNENDIRALGRDYIYAAQSFLFNSVEKGYHNFESLQVQCLLVLARQVLNVGGDVIWSLIGFVAHSAMQIGLHRDPERFRTFSVLQCEVRRRLWSTILEMMVQAALDSGMPLPLGMDDFDTKAPCNVNDHELSAYGQSAESHPPSHLTDSSIQILLRRYLETRHQIVRYLNKPGMNADYEQILRLSSVISKACREAQRLDSQETILESGIFKYNLTDLFLRRFIPHLHQSFANIARQDPRFHFSRKARLDAAMALLAPKPDPDFSHLIFGGGGIFKSRIKQCALTVGSELLAEVEEDCNFARNPSKSFRGMLIEVAKDAASEALQRLQFGETSVKLHMTLSMVITRAQSTSHQSSIQLEMAQSAKESLQNSLSILKMFLGPTVVDGNNEPPDICREHSQELCLGDGLDFLDFFDGYDIEPELLTLV